MKLRHLDLYPPFKEYCKEAGYLELNARGDTARLLIDSQDFLAVAAFARGTEVLVIAHLAEKIARQCMMRVIHKAWWSGSDKLSKRIWEKQNGYGDAGFMPPQGYDWSGIRDSSMEAVKAMYLVAREHDNG